MKRERYRLEMPPRRCWNCKDAIDAARRVPLCPVCRRTYGWGIFVGGVIVGALMKLIG